MANPAEQIAQALLARQQTTAAQIPQVQSQIVPRTFNTQLSPAGERAFQIWKAKFAPNDSGVDYDLRGAFLQGLQPSPVNGHWPDTFKKPNHPTFSDQSQYAPYGNPGSWQGEQFIPGTMAPGMLNPAVGGVRN